MIIDLVNLISCHGSQNEGISFEGKVDHCAHHDHYRHDHHDDEDGCGFMATMVTPSQPCPTNAHKQTDLPIFLSMMLVLMMMMIVMKNSHMAIVRNQFINIL